MSCSADIPTTWEELDDCQTDAGVVHDIAKDTVAHLKVGSIAGEIVEVPTAEMTTIGDVKNFLKSDSVVKLFRHDQELLEHDEVPNKVGAIVRTQTGSVLSDGDIIQMAKVKKSVESARPKEKTLTRREEIAKTLQDFKHKTKKQKMLVPTSNSYDRALVHTEAEKSGLHTFTKQNRLFVTRRPPYDGTGNDAKTLINNHMNLL